MRLKRQPDYGELRAYAGPDPITARPRYVSRTFRGGKRDANKGLAPLVAEVDSIGTHDDQSVAGLLFAHIDHRKQRGREARTIESHRGIAPKVAADRLGGKMIWDRRTSTTSTSGSRAKGLSHASVWLVTARS